MCDHFIQIAEEYNEDEDIRPQVVHVNLDPKLLLLLREIHYLTTDPFNIRLPSTARNLLRNTDSHELRVTATRLETITSKYNTVMKTISDYELPLFERSLAKIDIVSMIGLCIFSALKLIFSATDMKSMVLFHNVS